VIVSTAAVILAGGSGTRVGAVTDGVPTNKVYLPVADRSVLSWSVRAFLQAGVTRLVVVTRADELDLGRTAVAAARDGEADSLVGDIDVIAGGIDRQGSEYAALRHLAEEIESGRLDVVAIHDGARPLVTPRLICEVLTVAREHGGAVPAIGVDELAELGDGVLSRPIALGHAVRVQTPQAFAALPLLQAYRAAAEVGFSATDTAGCMQEFGGMAISTVDGDPRNLKITFPSDLAVAEQLFSHRSS
jgi:2-C-methyl-D-erythritol 4-phosphate cytidylyltransferase